MTFIRVLAGAACVAAAALIFLWVSGPMANGRQVSRMGDLMPGPCTVAAPGTAMTVQIDGIGSPGACERYAESGSWYQVPNGAPGAVLCQVIDRGFTYIVRDTGALMLYGNAACSTLIASTSTQPLPDYTVDGDIGACDPNDTPGCGSDVPIDPGTLPMEDQVRDILRDVGNSI